MDSRLSFALGTLAATAAWSSARIARSGNPRDHIDGSIRAALLGAAIGGTGAMITHALSGMQFSKFPSISETWMTVASMGTVNGIFSFWLTELDSPFTSELNFGILGIWLGIQGIRHMF